MCRAGVLQDQSLGTTGLDITLLIPDLHVSLCCKADTTLMVSWGLVGLQKKVKHYSLALLMAAELGLLPAPDVERILRF